ncbi:hypothetical protein Trydic_g22973 [Trypoxylus dichotomus]
MGVDKYENEDLIRWGWPEDVWFHVDQMSSAHVYLRLKPGQTIDDIPSAVLEDAAQLVKANSITGQVGFHKEKDVRKIAVAKRINEIVNRLNKTKKEELPDLRAEREKRDRLEREDKKKLLRDQKEKEKEEAKRKEEEAELRSYTTLMKPENMECYDKGNDSDDFM